MNPRFRHLLEMQGYEDFDVANLLNEYQFKSEEQAYNIRKQIDISFQNIDYDNKESLSDSIISEQNKLILRELQYYSQDSLKDLIMNQKWAEIIPLIEDIIYQLERNQSDSYILRLIGAANIDFDILDDYPLTLFEVVTTLRTLLIEVRIDFELHNYLSALAKARRCKSVLEYAVYIMSTIEEENLPLVTKSQIQKVDEVDGKSIYKIK